jgi:Ca2+-binding EF-hand superfamily protein
MRLILVILAFLAADAGAARPIRLFDQWNLADRDGDGRLSRAEAASMPKVAGYFEAIDRDGDGFVSAEEVRAWRGKRTAQTKFAGGGLAALFARADANLDGALDRREAEAALPRLKRNFDSIDADRDGAVSRAELDAWIARRRVSR